MGCGWRLSRRAVLRSWLVSLLGKTAAGAAGSGFDPVGFTLHGLTPAIAFQQRYSMDAAILLLGAPVFTRQAAGGGYASVEISRDEGTTALALQFAAGSSPARAHGLNRFGILREAMLERAGATESSFAGLMTRSREESFEQGRKAINATGSGVEALVARGRMTASAIESWIDTIDLSPDCNWSNLSETLCEALRREPQTPVRETSLGVSTTFLHAMYLAAFSKEPVCRREFVQAGKPYWLETRRHPDRPLELAGAIYDYASHRCAEFRTAYAPADPSGIPVRIEYRPRSFLRLTFVAEPGANLPPVPSVFHQENA